MKQDQKRISKEKHEIEYVRAKAREVLFFIEYLEKLGHRDFKYPEIIERNSLLYGYLSFATTKRLCKTVLKFTKMKGGRR